MQRLHIKAVTLVMTDSGKVTINESENAEK